MYRWTENTNVVKEIKEMIEEAEDCEAEIWLMGWSWGAVTSMQVAEKLEADGYDVTKMFLFDPVFKWRTRSKSTPTGVEEVHSYYQTSFRHRGSALTPNGGSLTQQNLNPYKTNEVSIDGVLVDIDHTTILWAAEQKFNSTF